MTLHDFMMNTILSTPLRILNQNNGKIASGTCFELSKDEDINKLKTMM